MLMCSHSVVVITLTRGVQVGGFLELTLKSMGCLGSSGASHLICMSSALTKSVLISTTNTNARRRYTGALGNVALERSETLRRSAW